MIEELKAKLKENKAVVCKNKSVESVLISVLKNKRYK